jgi:hypothetical protein
VEKSISETAKESDHGASPLSGIGKREELQEQGKIIILPVVFDRFSVTEIVSSLDDQNDLFYPGRELS